mgnify:CR=1 FL=1
MLPAASTRPGLRLALAPPSSGGIAVLQMLGVLETRDLRRMGLGPHAVHWFA